MSDLPAATRGADQLSPPCVSGAHAITATDTTNSAASLDLGITRGSAWFTLQARGGDVYVRFGATATTATTTVTGFKIPNGEERHFFVSPKERYVDHICSAAGQKLNWWQSSPNYDNR